MAEEPRAVFQLNNLLAQADIEPERAVVMRHQPKEPKLRSHFPWIALNRPDLFNTYQSSHHDKATASLLKAGYLVSFIGHQPKQALFIGIYEICGYEEISYREYSDKPENVELFKFGMLGWDSDKRSKIIWFDLRLTNHYLDWSGRLVVKWPGLERSWYRQAARNAFEIDAIAQESLLEGPSKSWDELVLEWSELQLLPQRLRNRLSQWRGIYLIIDRSDGMRYVGSAYGADNILGRWMAYCKSGHGGNVELKERNPENFAFSILQRLSPDLPAEDVMTIEASWKRRLHTHRPLGLNLN